VKEPVAEFLRWGYEEKVISAQESSMPTLPLPDESVCPFGPVPEVDQLRENNSSFVRVQCPTGITAWLVTRYADVREVLGDPRRFSSRGGSAGHLLNNMPAQAPIEEGDFFRMDGAAHLRFRRAIAPAVGTVKRINAIRPMAQRIVNDTLDALSDAPHPIDLHEQFSKPITTAVIAQLFGVPYADRAVFHEVAQSLFSTATDQEDFSEVLAPLFGYVNGLLAARRDEPGDDALSILIRRNDGLAEPLTDLELIKITAGLLAAGYDTTASLITYGVLALLQFPEQYALLHKDPTSVTGAAEELLRLLGDGGGLLRVATVDTEISGNPIAKGDYVVLAVQAANQDPRRFTDPGRLDITRTDNHHMGFGFGPHQCVGQQVARLELTTVLDILPSRVPSLRLAIPFEEIEFKTNTVIFGPAHLPVSWDAILPRS
jgi:cytochrome P450